MAPLKKFAELQRRIGNQIFRMYSKINANINKNSSSYIELFQQLSIIFQNNVGKENNIGKLKLFTKWFGKIPTCQAEGLRILRLTSVPSPF